MGTQLRPLRMQTYMHIFNPFKSNGISNSYQFDNSIFVLMLVVFLIFIQKFIEYSASRQWRPDQTPRAAASDQGLRCLLIPYRKDARVIWVNPSTCNPSIPLWDI